MVYNLDYDHEYYMAQFKVIPALHRCAILEIAIISDILYRPRRGRIMEPNQTPGTITCSTQRFKPCLTHLIIDSEIRPLQGRECHAGTFMLSKFDPAGVSSDGVFRIYWFNCDEPK